MEALPTPADYWPELEALETLSVSSDRWKLQERIQAIEPADSSKTASRAELEPTAIEELDVISKWKPYRHPPTIGQSWKLYRWNRWKLQERIQAIPTRAELEALPMEPAAIRLAWINRQMQIGEIPLFMEANQP